VPKFIKNYILVRNLEAATNIKTQVMCAIYIQWRCANSS